MNIKGFLWASLSIATLSSGLALWTFITNNAEVNGTLSLVVFMSMVVSSSIGIGYVTGLCAEKAQVYLFEKS